LKPGLGVTQGHRNDTNRSTCHDFLLTFHQPISHRYRDKRIFPSKIAKFFPPTPVYLTPPMGSPWNWVLAPWVKKLEWWGYQKIKKF